MAPCIRTSSGSLSSSRPSIISSSGTSAWSCLANYSRTGAKYQVRQTAGSLAVHEHRTLASVDPASRAPVFSRSCAARRLEMKVIFSSSVRFSICSSVLQRCKNRMHETRKACTTTRRAMSQNQKAHHVLCTNPETLLMDHTGPMERDAPG